jgi:hypothetical protein
MRFEELAYAVDGLPAAVRFHARLTVVCLPAEERADWIARLFGVLEGTRAGDSTGVIYLDRRGRRIGLDRDDQGSATLIELATGAEVPYSASHLSLDGRFDWFASNGLTFRAASDLILVGSGAFTGNQKYDARAIGAKLDEARKRLVRVEGRLKSATTRLGRRDELRDRIAALDEQVAREEAERAGAGAEADAVRAAATAAEEWWRAVAAADDARRTFGSRPRLDADLLSPALAQPTDVPDDLESLAKACRAVAERRDELVDRLEDDASAEVDERAAGTRRELIEQVEPAFVDALAALAAACRPFDVTIDAARLEAAGVGAAGIEAMSSDVLAEVAARAAEARDARLQRALEDAEAQCRATREGLERHLAGLGFNIDGVGDLAAGAESVAARAGKADNPSVEDTRRAIAERRKLEQALQRVERNLPDVAELTDKHSDLEAEVAALEAMLNAGRSLVSAQEAEMILLGRATEAGRNDRRREPLPLVVDDALSDFGTSDKRRLLDAFARCADTTQVVYLTDDPATLSWASSLASDGEISLWGRDDVATVA